MKKQILGFLVVSLVLFGCLGQTLEPPTNLHTDTTNSGISLTWSPSSSTNVIGYNIYRCEMIGQLGNKINGGLITETLFTDSNVEEGKTYYYTVRAVDSGSNEENNLNQISATAQEITPDKTPTVEILSPKNNDVLQTHFDISFEVEDTSGDVNCNAYADDSVIPIQSGKTELSIILTDGGHQLHIECSDDSGEFKSNAVKFTTEENPVSLQINNGDAHTDSKEVTLQVHAPSASQCRFSNDNKIFSIWQTHQSSIAWTLDEGDGEKTVYVECKNANEVSLGTASDVIKVDSTPAYLSMAINNGDSKTDSRHVKISIYSTKELKRCQFSTDEYNYMPWENFQTSIWFNLPSGDGEKTVYLRCEDESGKVSTASDSIELREEPQEEPTKLEIKINGNDKYTDETSVRLTLGASNAEECRYRNEDDDWSNWHDYEHHRNWELSSGEGTKTVYYECRNDYGTSDTEHDKIVLRSNSPTVTIENPVQKHIYADEFVSLVFNVHDKDSSIVSCTYYCNGEINEIQEVETNKEINRCLLSTVIGCLSNCGVPSAGSEFTIDMTCTDEDGNQGSSKTVVFSWSKFVGPLK